METDLGGETATGASIDAKNSLVLAAGTSAAIVETELGENELNSTGASATVDRAGGDASLCQKVDWDGSEMVSIDETPENVCEAMYCLGLTVYRTRATPPAVPKRMVSICSKTMPSKSASGRHLRRCQRCYTTKSNCGTPAALERVKILILSEKQIPNTP
jgi:hypothetical protein